MLRCVGKVIWLGRNFRDYGIGRMLDIWGFFFGFFVLFYNVVVFRYIYRLGLIIVGFL